MVLLNLFAGQPGDADIENTLVDTVGEGEGGAWESNIENVHITIWKIDNQWELVWLRELKASALTASEGWDVVGGGREFQEGGDIQYTYGWFTLMWGIRQHNIVKILSFH